MVKLHPEVFATACNAAYRTTLDPRNEVSWAGEVPTYGPHVKDSDSRDGATDDMVLDAKAYDFDLR